MAYQTGGGRPCVVTVLNTEGPRPGCTERGAQTDSHLPGKSVQLLLGLFSQPLRLFERFQNRTLGKKKAEDEGRPAREPARLQPTESMHGEEGPEATPGAGMPRLGAATHAQLTPRPPQPAGHPAHRCTGQGACPGTAGTGRAGRVPGRGSSWARGGRWPHGAGG